MENKELKDKKILEVNQIPNTPFQVIKTTESKNYYVVLGKTRIETQYDKLEDVVKDFEKPTFENIMFMVEAIINFIKTK